MPSFEPDTLERIVPDQVPEDDAAGRESLALHYERYAFAARHARGPRLLDLACGVGYGTRALAEARADLTSLTGVDLSEGAVEYATAHYADDRVRFVRANAMTFAPSEGSDFDTIVSLETIEHLPEPDRFFDRLQRLLAPGGVLVASVPTTPSVDLNPHHLHDFTLAQFRAMGARNGLDVIAEHTQVQRVGLFELARRDHRFRRESLRPNLLGHYARHPSAMLRRIGTTLRFGLANHYTTIAWQRPA